MVGLKSVTSGGVTLERKREYGQELDRKQRNTQEQEKGSAKLLHQRLSLPQVCVWKGKGGTGLNLRKPEEKGWREPF